MGLFDKVTKTVSNVGSSAIKSAAKVGSSAAVAVQEQTELTSLKTQINVIEQELSASYI